MRPASTGYLEGAIYGLLAVTIWASWSAVTRFAVTTRLDAFDVVALRFCLPGLLLLGVVLRRGLALDRLGRSGLALLVIGGGAPYSLLAASGLKWAPAHHHAALNPGFMPLLVALFAALALGERLSLPRKLGLALILLGAGLILAGRETGWDPWMSLGHALFLLAALVWAAYTVLLRRAGLDPLHAVALVSVGSLVAYLPFYLALKGGALLDLPPVDLALQAGFQGMLVTIVSLVLYGRAVALLGASGGAAFGALVPGLTALIAIPLLGEWPGGLDWLAILSVSLGVYLTSGGPLPTPR